VAVIRFPVYPSFPVTLLTAAGEHFMVTPLSAADKARYDVLNEEVVF